MHAAVEALVNNGANRRRAAVLAASALLHVVVLGLLVWGALGVVGVPDLSLEEPPIVVTVEPRPTFRGERPHAARVERRETAPVGGAISAPTVRDDAPVAERPSALTPHLAPAPPAEAPPPEDRWAFRPESREAAVGRSLRVSPLGCRAVEDQLTPGERALCEDRFNETAARAGPVGPRTLTPQEARREAEFAREGARALAQYEARRRPLAGGTGIVNNGDCPGGNLGMGCAGAHLDPSMRQGATTPLAP